MVTKKAKVHMLPTEDKLGIGGLYKRIKATSIDIKLGEAVGDLVININPKVNGTNSIFEAQHLYFTTNEEIKEDDYVIDGLGELFGPYEKGDFIDINNIKGRKIVATTDKSLIIKTTRNEKIVNPGVYEKSLPQIPQQFIKEYVEAGGIDEVLLEYEPCYIDGYWEGYDRLKTDENNCVIIHFIETKLYTKEEVEELILKCVRETKISPISNLGNCLKREKDWIKENLK